MPRNIAVPRLFGVFLFLLAVLLSYAPSARAGWNSSVSPGLVTLDSGKRNNVFYVGDPVTFNLVNTSAVRYEVRDYSGNIVDQGPTTSPLTVHVSQPGWYKIYLHAATTQATYGDSAGATMFVIFRRNSNFPTMPAPTASNYGVFDGDEVARGVLGMGPQRHPVFTVSDPAGSIALLDPSIALDKQYYTGYDPQRTRPLMIAFPNGIYSSDPVQYQKNLAGLRQIVAHYHNDVKYWEPYNEPNDAFTGADYVNNELKPFYQTIKSIDPTCKVMGPAVVTIGPNGLGFIDQFLQAGGAKYIDAFSFHAYNNVMGDLQLARRSLNALNTLLTKYGVQNIEKWQTEQGYYAAVYGAYQPRTQGRWTMLEMMVFEQYGIPKEHNHLWYDKSHGFWDIPAFWENEDGPNTYGSFDPAAPLMRVWSEELYGTNFVQAYDFGDLGNKMYVGNLFSGSGKQVAAFQSAGRTDGSVKLNVSGGTSIHVVSAFGVEKDLPVTAGQVTLPVPELPVYVEIASGQTIQVVPTNYGTDLALLPGTVVTASGTGKSPINASFPNDITDLNNGIMETRYWPSGNGASGIDGPWMDNTAGFPAWVQITLPQAMPISHVVVYAGVPWQIDSSLLDYELQYDNNGQWTTIEHVQEPTTTFPYFTSTTFTTADSFYSDRCLFEHDFPTVTTQKIRLLVHDTTWGGGATADVVTAGGQTGAHNISLREIEVYGDGQSAALPNVGKLRFYPRSGWGARMVGGKFQGSVDGTTYANLYTVTSLPHEGQWTEVPLTINPRIYRYLRYLSPAGGWGNIDEVEFYSGTGTNAAKLTGTAFGTAGSYYNSGATFNNVFDGNTGSYFDAPIPDGVYAGLDIGPIPATLPVPVTTGAGSLAGSVATTPSAVNLTTEGTSDWAHWGLNSSTSFDHKATGSTQISDKSLIGVGTIATYANNPSTFTWTDGTSTATTTNTATGVYVGGMGKGFQITAPADTTVRTLKVYVGAWKAQGQLTATLSDGSAATFTDASVNDTQGVDTIRVYTLTYKAGSAGQTLTVTWTEKTDNGSGNVNFQAATLSAATAPVVVPVIIGTALTVPAVSDTTGQSVSLSATLTATGTSAAVAGQTVTFSVDGTAAGTSTTGSTGVATLNYTPTSSGSHTVSVAFAGTSAYSASAGSGTLTATAPVVVPVIIGTTLAVPAVSDTTGQSVSLSATLTATGTSAAVAGQTVTFSVDGTAVGTAATGSTGVATLNYTPTVSGSHSLAAAFAGTSAYSTASGSGTLTATAPVVTVPVTTPPVIVIPVTGSLMGLVATTPASVNLTTEGTADWAHWGLNSTASFDHKSSGDTQISDKSLVGGGTIKTYANNPSTFTWSDGTPTATATNTATGVYVGGVGNGFQITAPADTTVRTLKVYVGAYRVQGQLTATLSDGSAPVFTDASLNETQGADTIRVYTLTYKAGSAGQTLTVTWTEKTDNGGGNVNFQAATLSAATAPVVVPVITGTTLAVPSVSGTTGQGVSLSATLTATGTSAAVAGQTVTFSVDGTTVGTSTTGSTGIATLNYTPTISGSHSLAAAFAGTSAYSAANGSATLTATAPIVVPVITGTTLTVPAVGGTTGQGVSLSATLTATGTSAAVAGQTVTFSVDGTAVGTAATGSTGVATLSYTPTASGSHSLTAAFAGTSTYSAASGSGTLTATAPVVTVPVTTAPVVVIPVTGSLMGLVATTPASVNLTTEGTADWAHWGLTSAAGFNHKATGGTQISDKSTLGGTAMTYGNNRSAFTWSDGTPTASATKTTTGVYVSGVGTGFQITAPADTTVRTLKVYVGAWKAQGQLTATLSDGSAVTFTDASVNATTGSSVVAVYTLTYNAEAAGQTLTVTWTEKANNGNGNVTLQAATLSVATVTATPITVLATTRVK